MKILITDDNGYDRKLLRYTLEHHGFTDIVEACDGEEGMAVVRRDRPSLIISDALMPRMDGFQFLQAVKADDALRSIPFIFYSATYAGDKEINLALTLGAETFIVKPVEPDAFWKAISSIVKRIESGSQQSPMQPAEEETAFLKQYSRIVADKLEEKIRELEQAKSRIEQSEAFIRNILETVDEGFVVVDRSYRVLAANRAYCESVGLPREQILGKACFACSHKSDAPCYEVGEDCPVRTVFATGEPAIAQHTHFDESGAPLSIEVKAYPMKDRDGTVTSAIEIAIDVTERRSLEEQLRQAQKMEAIGRLAGGVAHDFNNILTAIVGHGSILQLKLPPDDPLLTNVQQILDSSNRAAALTRSLLTFSRKQIIRPVRLNLATVVRNLESFLRRIIGEDIELRTLLARDDVTVTADAVQIEQVLMNLATNARDAMPQGGLFSIKLDEILLDQDFIDRHGAGKPGPYAVLTVADTGSGMDEKTQERAFEPFFTTKEVGKGTGLGLSIVYGIVQQSNGLITLQSKHNAGTTFCIYLPLSVAPVVHQEGTAAAPRPSGGGETILIAEDDAVLRDLTEEFLRGADYTVIAAQDGMEAVEKFVARKDDIRLCILDLIMPKWSGRRASREIRAVKPDMKILYISGYPAESAPRESDDREHCEIILKPFSPQEILTQVRNLLDSSPGRQHASPQTQGT